MIAGCPLKRGFSASASRDAANATRSVLQKRHLIAAALIVSPQTGQILVSSFIGALLADLWPWGAASFFLCGSCDYVNEFVGLLVVDRFPDQDIRRVHSAPVIKPIPRVGRRSDGAVEIQAAVNALGTAKRDEVRDQIRLSAGADWPGGDGNVSAKLERT